MTEIVVLGAGPAGLAAAMELAQSGIRVTVVEQRDMVGGNAGSFEFGGVKVDFGSHRLHPASDPRVLEKIRTLLGEDLLQRPRHGRIRLMGRWIHFPLRPVDLVLRMHPRFAMGVGIDLLRKLIAPGKPVTDKAESFATILQKGLGKTICKEFYFPYARKIWGLQPEELSPIQARKRVSAGSIGKMLKRLLPGGTGSGGANTKGIFFYPRYGFGQISEAMYKAAEEAGARVLLNSKISQVSLNNGQPRVVIENGSGQQETLVPDQLFSTIPMTVLVRLLDTDIPEDVTRAVSSLEFRSMMLVYLKLDQSRFTEFDAHYFPGADLPFTRVSEPKNYSDRTEPEGHTVLCVEMPCFQEDLAWSMSDGQLSELISDGLARAGLPIRSGILEVKAVRIPYAYPLYRSGYEKHFEKVDDWVSRLSGVLSFGRQGLYVHDNTHHAIYMAMSAVKCLREDGSIDETAWKQERRIFETHVVED